MYRDYSSFGSGPKGTDKNDDETQCRANFDMLIDKLKQYERSVALYKELQDAQVEVDLGQNDFVKGFEKGSADASDPENHVFTRSIDNGVISSPAWCHGEAHDGEDFASFYTRTT